MPFLLQNGTRGLVAQQQGGGGGAKCDWRIFVPNGLGGTIALNEVKFIGEVGGDPLTSDSASESAQRATGSSYDGESVPLFAFLPNSSFLEWEPLTRFNEWVAWRFDEHTEINQVSYRVRTTSLNAPTSVIVQSSLDGGKTWQDEWSDESPPTTHSVTIVIQR